MFDRLPIWRAQKEKLKLKYDEIAMRSNIPKGTIQNIFAGYIDNPRIDTVKAIEQALGLPEWTADEKALGVGEHTTTLSEEETEWLELRSEILEVGGKDYLNAVYTLLRKIIETNKK